MAKSDFTYHKVSDSEKEQIRKQTKKLMDEFSSKLDKIKTKESHFASSTEKTGMRQQGTPWKTDPTFHDLMLLNAPLVEDDFIVAEKGGWK